MTSTIAAITTGGGGVDTSFLVATLVASIQELKAIIDAQATRIAALESKYP